MPNGKSASKKLADQWMRDIRTATRSWASSYKPKQDMTPVEEVKDILYTFLLTNHPDLIDLVFTSPIYTPYCTWHIVGRDAKAALKTRGYVLLPNVLDDGSIKDEFKSTDVLFRQSTQTDDVEYIELERDMLGALLDRQDRRVVNAQEAVARTKQRRSQLQKWARASRAKQLTH